ncbi:dynein regulatory complex protein 8 [Aegotheles albertisi]
MAAAARSAGGSGLRRAALGCAEARREAVDCAIVEIEKIIEAFELFDHECKKSVDVRCLLQGCTTIVGLLMADYLVSEGGSTTQFLSAIVDEEEEPTGYINLEKFLPVMTKVLLDRSYWPIPDVLLHAFEAMGENKCGYVTKEDPVKYLTEEEPAFLVWLTHACLPQVRTYVQALCETYQTGTLFSERDAEEMEDILSAALDPETNTLCYRDYVSKMIVDES